MYKRQVNGYDGNDNLYGGDQADQISGGTGNDNLASYAGNDLLLGEEGNDTLDGGIGNDIMDGGAGNDTLLGSPGSDTYVFRRGSGYDTMRVADGSAGKVDTLRLDGLNPEDIRLEKWGDDLAFICLLYTSNLPTASRSPKPRRPCPT